MPRFRSVTLAFAIFATIGCSDSRSQTNTAADSTPAPAPSLSDLGIIRAPDSLRIADSLRRERIAEALRDTVVRRRDSVLTSLRRGRKFVVSARDSVRWPVAGPDTLPGSLVPSHRIVAYYGNPLSKRMGILGQIPPDSMMARLEETAHQWAAADPFTPVRPALHLIVTVAQGKPGRDGKYRLRMPDALVDTVAAWAERKGWLLFLDIQVGQSTVQAEVPRVLPYLARPYVHLALDPEFAMKGGALPGKKIGTLDAAELNWTIERLGTLVDSLSLPPKVLVVHRFTRPMLTNAKLIKRDPRVQIVIDMDGFGAPFLKHDSYRDYVVREPVQYTGFKLFYKNDKPLMTPDDVLALWPQPVYIQYQ